MQLMDLEYYLATLLISLFIFLMAVNFPLALMMHLLMPKATLEKYFKPPHFGEAEVVFFTGLPFCIIRTVMFMTIFAFPHRGKKRGLTEAYLMAPPWYRRLSKFYVISLVLTMGTILPMVFIGSIYYTYTGQMEW